MRVRATSKGLQFETEFIGPIPETLRTDPTRLKQILLNLIGNAIKFTETGGVRVVVRLAYHEAGEATQGEPVLQFDIVDTGIGMDDEQIARLFQPFNQADGSTTRRFGGTGLGLAISKRLATTLGGDIEVQSKPDTGSTFRLTIATGPLADVGMREGFDASTEVQNRLDESSLPELPKISSRVLLAEDGPDNQRLISFVLKKAGAQVTVVDDGRAALEAVQEARRRGEDFGVILMDMQMPVMDGYTATRELRQSGYTGPIVALTAHAMPQDRGKCISAGCDDYATKPIDRQRLLEIISYYAAPNRSRQSPVEQIGANPHLPLA
jgi:CheY-like chemotaxis protein/anti-sigma regulatory factor (Ser/Thr protein kinase)